MAKKEQVIKLQGCYRDKDGNAHIAKTSDASKVEYFHGKLKGFSGKMHDVFVRAAGKCIEVTSVASKAKYILTKHPSKNLYWNQNPKKASVTPKMHCHMKKIVAELRFWA